MFCFNRKCKNELLVFVHLILVGWTDMDGDLSNRGSRLYCLPFSCYLASVVCYSHILNNLYVNQLSFISGTRYPSRAFRFPYLYTSCQAYLIPGSKSCNPSVLLLITSWIRELLTWKSSKFFAQNRVWWISLQGWWRHNSSWSSVNFSADILNGLDTSLRNVESLPAFKRGLPVSKVIFDS